jgi:hypothetical protein
MVSAKRYEGILSLENISMASRSRKFAIAAFLLLFCLPLGKTAIASLLIVSGDSNIGNAINGTSGAPVNPDNATWFTNILGSGSTVKLLSDVTGGSAGDSVQEINDHYNSLSGVSSSVVSPGTTISPTLLAGVDLFLSFLPSDDYAAGEITALENYLTGGGSLFFLGENNNFTATNTRINAALSGLGSGMSIVSALIDAGFNTTTNIDADLLNVGVSSFTYAATSRVVGGTSLVRTAFSDETFVAYEGEIMRVPEPATILLLGVGIAGIGVRIRKHLRA